MICIIQTIWEIPIFWQIPMSYKNYIFPIKLPKRVQHTIPCGEQATVYGWGNRFLGDRDLRLELRAVNTTHTTNPVCNTTHKGGFTADMLCAGNSTCNFDSGGPLTGEGVLLGVVSFTEPNKKCNQRYPTVFARVSFFVSWIRSRILFPGN